MAIKVGQIVTYRSEGPPSDPRLNLPATTVDYPAIIYRIYPDPLFVGLYVFTEDGLRLMRKVVFDNEKTDCWRLS